MFSNQQSAIANSSFLYHLFSDLVPFSREATCPRRGGGWGSRPLVPLRSAERVSYLQALAFRNPKFPISIFVPPSFFSNNETCSRLCPKGKGDTKLQIPNFPDNFFLLTQYSLLISPISAHCSLNYGILRPALQSERTFLGIVLITTEACPMETRSGFFVARRGASARKSPLQAGNGTCPAVLSRRMGPAGVLRGIGGRSHQNTLLGVIAKSVLCDDAISNTTGRWLCSHRLLALAQVP